MAASLNLAGSDIGRYHLVSLIGAGGMGEVYDAIDSSLGRHVALKILKSDAVSDPKRLARFVQEARTASTLNHPHLVSIYEIGEHAGVHFIAMEKIDGSTLREIFSSRRLTIKRALELMVQITEALAAAHGAGVVHRDLKPENIMVSRAGYAKVLDFGLAKLQPETVLPPDPSASTLFKATDSGTVLGTVGYMSPEQAQGKPADPRSDIFSLGCVLYEAVAGRRAFQGATSIDTLHAIIHNEPAPLREIAPDAPIEIQRIVRKALAKDPEERYQSAKEMAIDLRNAGKEMESVAQTDAKPARLRVARLVSIAAVVIIAAIVIAEAVLRRTPAKPSLQIQRITTTGDVINATISPDGKYMAYVRSNEKGQSLWFRQLATNQDLELVSPPQTVADPVGFWGGTFTPDGNAILYVLKRSSRPEGALYRIATLGGRSEHLLNGIDSPSSFSPDGKRIAYVRADFPGSGESALMIAASDGSNAHPIATRRYPEQFAPIWFAGPSWSPDGRVIAAAVHRAEDPIISKVIGIDPESGRETVIADVGWQHVGRVAWLPNGRGLIAIAGADPYTAGLAQIWFVPFPDGSPRQVTHDLVAYRSASVAADGKTMMSVATDQIRADIWRIPLDRRGEPERLVAGSADGGGGVSYLPDGRIVFPSIEGAISVISTASAGTVHVSQLVKDRYTNSYPAAFANGIAYTSSTSKGTEICVISLAGEERRVIVPNGAGPIAVTRDGKWLIYGNNGRLWKISLDDGRASLVFSPQSDAVKLHPGSALSWSPTGDRIAFFYGNFESTRLGVVAADSGALLWSVPASVPALGGFVRWTHDGSALLTNALGTGDRSNLWRIPLNGQAQKLTNFYGQMALAFDVSPDGKDIALARAELTRDAVLIRGFE